MVTKKLTEPEFRKIVLDLAKQNMTSEKIGLILKKEHGIKNSKKEFGMRISKVLKENNAYINPDQKNLKDQVEMLKKHLIKHRLDHSTRRCLLIQEAKLRKIENLLK